MLVFPFCFVIFAFGEDDPAIPPDNDSSQPKADLTLIPSAPFRPADGEVEVLEDRGPSGRGYRLAGMVVITVVITGAVVYGFVTTFMKRQVGGLDEEAFRPFATARGRHRGARRSQLNKLFRV
jgi:hypothetical protein